MNQVIQGDYLFKYSSNFRIASMYKQVECTPKDIVFYFEKVLEVRA